MFLVSRDSLPMSRPHVFSIALPGPVTAVRSTSPTRSEAAVVKKGDVEECRQLAQSSASLTW